MPGYLTSAEPSNPFPGSVFTRLIASLLGVFLFACGSHPAPPRSVRVATTTPVQSASPAPLPACRATCKQRVLPARQLGSILLDAEYAYFVEAEKLYAEPLAGGERRQLFDGDVGNLIDAGDGLLACRVDAARGRGTQLLLIPKRGGASKTLATDVLCGPAAIGEEVYFVRLLRDNRAQLERVSKQGGPSQVLFELEGGTWVDEGALRRDLASLTLTTDSRDLFWVLEDDIWRFNVAQGTRQRLTSLANAQRVVALKGKLYCATDDTIFEVEADGQTRAAANFQHASALSASGDFVYWSGAGLVRFDPVQGTVATLANSISYWSLSAMNDRVLFITKTPTELRLMEDCGCTPAVVTQSPAIRKPTKGTPSADFYFTENDGELYFTVSDPGGDEDDQINTLAKRYGANTRIKPLDPDVPERFEPGKRYLVHTTKGSFERPIVSLHTSWETDYGWRLQVGLGASPPGDSALVTVLGEAIRFPTDVTSTEDLSAKYLPAVQREYKQAGIVEPVTGEHLQVKLGHFPAPYAALIAVDVPDPNGSFGERYAALFLADAAGNIELSLSPPRHDLSAESLAYAIDLHADGTDDVFVDSRYYEGGASELLVWGVGGVPRMVTLRSWGN